MRTDMFKPFYRIISYLFHLTVCICYVWPSYHFTQYHIIWV